MPDVIENVLSRIMHIQKNWISYSNIDDKIKKFSSYFYGYLFKYMLDYTAKYFNNATLNCSIVKSLFVLVTAILYRFDLEYGRCHFLPEMFTINISK